jgi:hypothetical protein
MPSIFVKYPDGSEASIDPRGDASRRVLIGSSDQCQIRLQGEGILPIHAYLARRSNHYYLLLAPGATVLCNGHEVTNERSPEEDRDLDHFEMVRRDRFVVKLAGAAITVHDVCDSV